MAEEAGIETPAFIYDAEQVVSNAKRVRSMLERHGLRMLYSLKALGIAEVVVDLAPVIEGTSVSSPLEAMLAREALGDAHLLHYVSAAIREQDVTSLAVCDRVTLGSFGQVARLGERILRVAEVGLRLNPETGFVDDERYDPCRPGSRLGVPLSRWSDWSNADPSVSGLHVHNNCDSSDPCELVETVHKLNSALGRRAERFHWLNLGGGYTFDGGDGWEAALGMASNGARSIATEIWMEPGAAIVRDAGYFVSTVLDITRNRGLSMVTLDTTVNHWPEVFEYQFEPDVHGHVDTGRHEYILAGSSCLAGDSFGTYSFRKPLEVGSRVVFLNAGAYSLAKAHLFNGIALPSIYRWSGADLTLLRRYTYDDFKGRYGGRQHAPDGTGTHDPDALMAPEPTL